ncbi:MAG: ABC transporter permease [Ignavibacteriae bacterium]|nr:ABC transporter permease [Ignavibacteriota bacterium]
MITLIYLELQKILKKWRTYIGFLSIGILVPLAQWALFAGGMHGYEGMITRRLGDSFITGGNILNGYLLAYIVLQGLYVHFPFLIVLVGGDLFSSEATAGTYRLLLTRPVSRFQVVTSKFTAGLIYTALLILWLMLLSLGVSVLLFGSGALMVFVGKIYIFSSNDVLWRFMAAYGFAFLSLSTIFTLAFLFSSLVENAIGPIITTMAVIIVFTILSFLPFEVLDKFRPYFFTTYLDEWKLFFSDPIDFVAIIKSGIILISHILVFYFVTLIIFIKKDILT